MESDAKIQGSNERADVPQMDSPNGSSVQTSTTGVPDDTEETDDISYIKGLDNVHQLKKLPDTYKKGDPDARGVPSNRNLKKPNLNQ